MDWKNLLIELIPEPFHRNPFRPLGLTPRMYYHARRLIDCDEEIIRIQDIEWCHEILVSIHFFTAGIPRDASRSIC